MSSPPDMLAERRRSAQRSAGNVAPTSPCRAQRVCERARLWGKSAPPLGGDGWGHPKWSGRLDSNQRPSDPQGDSEPDTTDATAENMAARADPERAKEHDG